MKKKKNIKNKRIDRLVRFSMNITATSLFSSFLTRLFTFKKKQKKKQRTETHDNFMLNKVYSIQVHDDYFLPMLQ